MTTFPYARKNHSSMDSLKHPHSGLLIYNVWISAARKHRVYGATESCDALIFKWTPDSEYVSLETTFLHLQILKKSLKKHYFQNIFTGTGRFTTSRSFNVG